MIMSSSILAYNDTTSLRTYLDLTTTFYSDEIDPNPATTVVTTIDPSLEEVLYCNSSSWKRFHQNYSRCHGHISILVCIFGIIANLLNLIVLTRKGMISPTNAILTGLALADLLNMVEYIPYAFFMYIWKPPYTYAFALFILVHANFAQICHTVSIWLTLTLAVWRYIAVGVPTRSVAWCTMDRAKWAIASAYFFSPVISIPVYLGFSIRDLPRKNHTDYYVDLSDLAQANDNLLEKVNFWIYSVVIKLIPGIALTIVSFRLINALMDAKRRKEKLLAKKRTSTVGGGTQVEQHHNVEADRTTRMLLAVLLLYLIAEIPQGVLGLLSGVLGNDFFSTCYKNLGELMDLVTLVNCAINFILYCVMSKKFRQTFQQLFGIKQLSCCRTDTASPLPRFRNPSLAPPPSSPERQCLNSNSHTYQLEIKGSPPPGQPRVVMATAL